MIAGFVVDNSSFAIVKDLSPSPLLHLSNFFGFHLQIEFDWFYIVYFVNIQAFRIFSLPSLVRSYFTREIKLIKQIEIVFHWRRKPKHQ